VFRRETDGSKYGFWLTKEIDMQQELARALTESIEELWQTVNWQTGRQEADQVRRQVIQACHRLHRAANPAYRARCKREGIDTQLESNHLPTVAFPEEIYKAYSEKKRSDGTKLGIFCERDVPLLLEHLNQYLVNSIRLDGLGTSYLRGTNTRGGLDQLKQDLYSSQEILLVTSSGTTGGAFSLIPLDKESFQMLVRANARTLREVSTVTGYGPIEPDSHCMVGYLPKGPMAMAIAFEHQVERFGDRGFLTIPSTIRIRDLRWRLGLFAGASGMLMGPIMKPLLQIGGQQMRRRSIENTIATLRTAEKLGLRTLVVANLWTAYSMLKRMEELLEEQGPSGDGGHYINLAPGSVLAGGGGNKSGLDIPEAEIVKLFRKLVGGLDKESDIYSQAEGYGVAIRCSEGNYHLDPHVEYFVVDSYLAYFDPRQTNRVPAIVTGDKVDGIHDETCPCGAPTRYFRAIQRDDLKRGSKGCAAALAEYA
jgi:hypothetical protein